MHGAGDGVFRVEGALDSEEGIVLIAQHPVAFRLDTQPQSLFHREDAASCDGGLVLEGVREEAREDVVDVWSWCVHAHRMDRTTDIPEL
ncbi:hypothetical protein GCM10027052_21320 [Parafrigoribacterium mesophilum]